MKTKSKKPALSEEERLHDAFLQEPFDIEQVFEIASLTKTISMQRLHALLNGEVSNGSLSAHGLLEITQVYLIAHSAPHEPAYIDVLHDLCLNQSASAISFLVKNNFLNKDAILSLNHRDLKTTAIKILLKQSFLERCEQYHLKIKEATRTKKYLALYEELIQYANHLKITPHDYATYRERDLIIINDAHPAQLSQIKKQLVLRMMHACRVNVHHQRFEMALPDERGVALLQGLALFEKDREIFQKLSLRRDTWFSGLWRLLERLYLFFKKHPTTHPAFGVTGARLFQAMVRLQQTDVSRKLIK